ncbi:ATPase, T2SS/T4P/T4SS family [Paenibacillus kandeliae]|uniref:ATPase, T2SS/T4P/T4SS family n=1 Tax=Paenibacillus kandeliae TaxID=3231269 RepID=UPI0034591068
MASLDMALLINRACIGLIVLILFVLAYFKLAYKGSANDKKDRQNSKYTLPTMIDYVKAALNEMTSSSLDDLGLSEEEYTRRLNQRATLIKSLKDCTHGDLNAKLFVKSTIYDLLLKTYELTEDHLNKVIPFEHAMALSSQEKFDILLYQYKMMHGLNGLSRLLEDYSLAGLKYDPESGGSGSYIITTDEINHVYDDFPGMLGFEDKLHIVVQRIYQTFKGFSVIDEIRDMKIDGVSGGVSGVPVSQVEYDDDFYDFTSAINERQIPFSHDSVWIFYRGKSVHLEFLSFGTEAELKRVCQNIYRYNNPGQLSEANGFKVNEMKDGSRIVVVRPSFSESWAFFVRKFDPASATLDQLITDNIANHDMVKSLLIYLMKGGRIVAITGAQGSGKTTLLMALVAHINETFTLRIQEMSFELHLRKIYNKRNILTFKETETVSGQAGLDVQKKTDGTVNILGEVATDEVAAWMIQMAQVASLFTIFTHHAKTFRDLVYSLRNALLKQNIFSNEKTAEEQVVRVLNFDVHLRRDPDGSRYIERITECIIVDQEQEYPTSFKTAKRSDERFTAMMESMTEYFQRSTNRKVGEGRNIIEYRNGRYVAVHPISDYNQQQMLTMMEPADQIRFQQFMAENWGGITVDAS